MVVAAPVARTGTGGMSPDRRSRSPPPTVPARTGAVRTARGTYPVPAFMPVGTRGSVKALDSVDLETLGAEVVLANTYHLMLRPGADVVAGLGRAAPVHRVARPHPDRLRRLPGPLTAVRPWTTTGSPSPRSTTAAAVRLTPESAVEAQGLIGADIQMVLDVCVSLPAPPEVLRVGRRAHRGVGRPGARRHHGRLEARPEGQALFGIVQGGTDPDLRSRERPAHGRRSTSTATPSAVCRSGSRGRPCWRPWPPRWPICPSTVPAT